jgi:hypothetical protein
MNGAAEVVRYDLSLSPLYAYLSPLYVYLYLKDIEYE